MRGPDEGNGDRAWHGTLRCCAVRDGAPASIVTSVMKPAALDVELDDNGAAATEKADWRKEVGEERTQRKLLTRAYLDLWQWAERMGLDSPAGPAPMPPTGFDLTPWR